MTALKVLRAGPYMSVQDGGRPGFLRAGVTQGGVVDPLALEQGRLLVGNQQGLAVIEILRLGGRFEVLRQGACAALTGANFTAQLDGKQLKLNTAFHLEPGKILEIGTSETGNYGYLSLSGGIETELVLSSRSTHVKAGFGGFKGRCLIDGDVLPIGKPGEQSGYYSLPIRFEPPTLDIRILWGAQADLFGKDEMARFVETSFEVTHDMDRMGVRLTSDTPPICARKGLQSLSGPIVLGDIQIPGNGRPIILLADRQPTGGYPRIATIIAADVIDFCQRPPGSLVRFKPVSEEEAIEALRTMRERLRGLPEQLVQRRDKPLQSHKLLSQNLISGVVCSSKEDK